MAEWEEENEPADKQYVPARTAPTVDLSQYEEDDLSIFRILAGEPPDRDEAADDQGARLKQNCVDRRLS
jgi:hypothetical protein